MIFCISILLPWKPAHTCLWNIFCNTCQPTMHCIAPNFRGQILCDFLDFCDKIFIEAHKVQDLKLQNHENTIDHEK